jgi:hypothetical protein
VQGEREELQVRDWRAEQLRKLGLPFVLADKFADLSTGTSRRTSSTAAAPSGSRSTSFDNYLKMLTARAATSRTVSDEIDDSESIRSFARVVSGIASVGLNAIEFVNET